MIRLGLVGAGRWGQIYVRTIAALADIQLATVFVRSPRTVPGLSPDCRLAVFAPHELDDLDGLIVATPPESHCAYAHAAIERHVPVLIEKPLTLDIDEARRLLSHADARNAVAMVEHTHLFHPAYRVLKDRLAELGGLAAVRSIRSAAGNRGPFRHDVSVLWDWGAHDVAMVLDLMNGMPVTVQVMVIGQHETPHGVGQSLLAKLFYPNDVVAEIRLSNTLTERLRVFSVECPQETLTYDDCADVKLTRQLGKSGDVLPVQIETQLPLTQAVIDFAALIESGTADRRGLSLGVSVVEVLTACQRSVDIRHPVIL